MNKLSTALIHPHMRNQTALEPEKNQITRLELIERDGSGIGILRTGGARQRNAGLGVAVMNKTTAVKSVRIRPAILIGDTEHLPGHAQCPETEIGPCL